ncbi:ATP:cob(I)alamin adenosyltransferase [Streptomyces sp. 110]|uniref:Corrinoid adenosyltransferase n=1 Tax=Streptomyces endocoffeicus TaxID=2898945 RepID=A0ABS1Q2H0_9ACTN|nr:ATP:cob(I)alamin adenosyltransferase [Streptomyces endocoffeicus]MBL1118465.1 ATP:cob(I)alamin adenosyltransferase [Streptomyces endocoffeicus]
MTDATLARQTALGDVEEANATIGAAISADAMTDDCDALLREVQRDLLDLAAGLTEPDPPRLGPAAYHRLEAARERYAPATTPPPGGRVLAGGCAGAGLLRLAGAVTRRAERSVRELAAAEPEGTAPSAAAYLSALAPLLTAVALRVDQEDVRNLTMGSCGDRPPPRPA